MPCNAGVVGDDEHGWWILVFCVVARLTTRYVMLLVLR